MVRTYWLNTHGWPRRRKFEGVIDWEQWVGPDRKVPKNPDLFFNWVMISEYGGGIVQGQGVHIFDSIHMVMDADWPVAVNASARYEKLDGIDQPISMVVTAEYPGDWMAIFTLNYAAMRYARRADQLNSYDGHLARMDIGRELLHVYDRDTPQKASITIDQPGGFANATIEHANNFLDCVKTRKQPNAPVEVGVKAALIVQMGALSVKQGRRMKWDRENRRAV